jgi:ribosomal protein L11 methyltransferase
MQLYEVQVLFNEENYDKLYGILYLNGIVNILEENGWLKFYLEEAESGKLNDVKQEITASGIDERNITVSKIENRNWNREWESSIEPVYINDKIVITPSWKKESVRGNIPIVIEIDPKMSFGTGHNETTQLVLGLMSEYLEPSDKYMLDFGSGTGILTIAAVKLGVDKAVAIDIEEEAEENSAEYFMINGVSPNVTFYRSDISGIKETGFDVVCANIIRSVIVENINSIYAKLKPGGKIFISGVLIEEEEAITKALSQNNFKIVKLIKKAEWLGIYGVKEQQDSGN